MADATIRIKGTDMITTRRYYIVKTVLPTLALMTLLTSAASAQADWRERIDEALANVSPRAVLGYFALGQQLAETPGREGLDALLAVWPTIDNSTFKQQIVKAWHFDFPTPYRVRFHPRAFEFFTMALAHDEPEVGDWAMAYLPTYAWRTFENEAEARVWLEEYSNIDAETATIDSMSQWIEAVREADDPTMLINMLGGIGYPFRRNDALKEAARKLDLADTLERAILWPGVTSGAVQSAAYMISELDPEALPRDEVSQFLEEFEKRREAEEAAEQEKQRADLEVRTVGDDDRKRWVLHPPLGDSPPERGRGLLVVLPGGDGSIDFAPFVGGAIRSAAGDDYIVVQMIAPPIIEGQDDVVWPCQGLPAKRIDFTMEPVVLATVEAVTNEYAIDPARIWAMGWSSGGTPAYELALMPDSPFAGAFVIMSVFKPDLLSPLDGGRDKSFYILHSPQDFIPMHFPEAAQTSLAAAGAHTALVKYNGGHGWHGDIGRQIRAALEWLEK
ncbi:MAG: hypothetical protein IIB54_13545 [Planctomycetes bacterium]|nr:hypothetical protein [Planctomycetota bacterium]